MTDLIEGTAALLYTPMTGKTIQLGEPSPFPLADGAAVRYQRRKVGEVTDVWVEGNRVRWRGRLDEREWPDITPDNDPLRVPFYEPDVRTLVAARRLVGVPAIVQARAETRAGGTLLSGWTVAGMELNEANVAPWPGLELRLTAVDRQKMSAADAAWGEW